MGSGSLWEGGGEGGFVGACMGVCVMLHIAWARADLRLLLYFVLVSACLPRLCGVGCMHTGNVYLKVHTLALYVRAPNLMSRANAQAPDNPLLIQMRTWRGSCSTSLTLRMAPYPRACTLLSPPTRHHAHTPSPTLHTRCQRPRSFARACFHLTGEGRRRGQEGLAG